MGCPDAFGLSCPALPATFDGPFWFARPRPIQLNAGTCFWYLAEVKAATDAFDRGDTNVFDALDAIRVAVESYAQDDDVKREAA